MGLDPEVRLITNLWRRHGIQIQVLYYLFENLILKFRLSVRSTLNSPILSSSVFLKKIWFCTLDKQNPPKISRHEIHIISVLHKILSEREVQVEFLFFLCCNCVKYLTLTATMRYPRLLYTITFIIGITYCYWSFIANAFS